MTSSALEPQFWNRDELYEDVWSHTLTALASKYSVSAVAIGKTCRKLQVPLPGRGYWAKKAHGYAVTRKPLPKVQEMRRIVRYQRPVDVKASPSPSPKPELPVENDDRVEIANITQMLSAGAFAVRKSRKALHHLLVVTARNVLRHGFVSKEILQTPWNESCLDIKVSKSSLSRALTIVAAIIAVLEDHGVKVKVTTGDRSYSSRSSETVATIFGEKIQFGLSERTRRVRVPDPPATSDATGRQRLVTHYEATGELSIHVFSNSSYFTTIWRDTEHTKIESLVPDCIASMMKIAVEYRRNTAIRNQEDLFRKLHWEELGQLKTQIETEEARIQTIGKWCH